MKLVDYAKGAILTHDVEDFFIGYILPKGVKGKAAHGYLLFNCKELKRKKNAPAFYFHGSNLRVSITRLEQKEFQGKYRLIFNATN